VTQAPLQSEVPVAVQRQTPRVQACPAPQRTPQPPQLFTSLTGLTQAPPHSMVPLAQAQVGTPVSFWQARAVPHETPQAPQFPGSRVRSTQAFPQRVVPAGQPPTHAPAMHVALPPVGGTQALPHAPQWAMLVAVSTHWPLQKTPEHINAQAPLLHTLPAGHALPQAPQLDGSLWRFTSQPLVCRLPSQFRKPG
jgi:hypothetical protein